jgi:hypothetical protein
MNDKVAFFQFGEINVEGGTGGQRVRGFQPAWPLNFVAAKNFRVGDNDEFCCFAKKSAGERAEVKCRTGVPPVSNFFSRAFFRWRQAGSLSYEFRPDFPKPLQLAVIVAEDMNGMVLAEPAVKLVEEFTALHLGDLRVRRAFAERTKGVERGKS